MDFILGVGVGAAIGAVVFSYILVGAAFITWLKLMDRKK